MPQVWPKPWCHGHRWHRYGDGVNSHHPRPTTVVILRPLQQESRLPNTPNTFSIWHHFPTQIRSIRCTLRTIRSTRSIRFTYNTADTYDELQQVQLDRIDHTHQHFHSHSYCYTLWSRSTDWIYRSINPFPIVLPSDHGQFIFYHVRLHFLWFIYILSHSSLFSIVPSHSESGSGSITSDPAILYYCFDSSESSYVASPIISFSILLFYGSGPSSPLLYINPVKCFHEINQVTPSIHFV